MSFMQTDEEADFLTVGSGNSRLVNIFTEPHIEKSTDLTYTAPKQPKKVDHQTPGISMSAIFTSVVHGYKFDGSKYVPQGKLGAAILGNHTIRSYKLLLYKGKQQPVAIATIGPKFVFTVQPNRYANFNDDQQGNWSVLFDTDAIIEEFAKQIGLARGNCTGPGASFAIVQPLSPGEGPSLEMGDAVQILYTAYLLSNHTFGQSFETNQGSVKPTKIRLGKGKYIKGLEEGLVGAKKNSKVLLVIPPLLGYGNQGLPAKVPPDSTLIYEVYISKTRIEKDSRSPTPTHSSQPTVKDKPLPIPEENIPTHVPFTSEAPNVILTSEDVKPMAAKNYANYNVVKRFHSQSAVGGESNHEIPANPVGPSPSIIYDPRGYSFSYLPPSASMTTYSGVPYPQMPFQSAHTMDAHLPMLVTETRTQNTEIRILLSKLEDKLDTLSKKVETKYDRAPPFMDPQLQLSIEKVLEDNSKLKDNNAENISHLTQLNKKISELLQQKSYSDISMATEHPTSRLAALEDEKTALAHELEEANNKMLAYQQELDSSQAQLAHIRNQLQNQMDEKNRNENKQLEHFQTELRDTQRQNRELQRQVDILQESLDNTTVAKDLIEKNLADRKQNLFESRANAAKEIDDIVAAHQKEMGALKDKLRKLESESNNTQLLEEEIREEWQSNLDRMVSENKSIYQKQLEELLDQKVELNLKVHDLEIQLTNANSNSETLIERVTKDLEDQWKVKFDLLQADNNLYRMETQSIIDRLKTQLRTMSEGNGLQLENNLNVELKRLVNAVYRSLQNDIDHDESYQGTDILQLVLETFRSITLQLLASIQNQGSKEDVTSEDEEEVVIKKEKLTGDKRGSKTSLAQETTEEEAKAKISESTLSHGESILKSASKEETKGDGQDEPAILEVSSEMRRSHESQACLWPGNPNLHYGVKVFPSPNYQ